MAAAAYSNRIMAHTCLDAHITGTTTTIHYGGSSVESMNGYSMNAVYNITTVFVYYHRTSISVWFIHKHITANLRPKINYLFICSETNPIYAIGS